MYFRIINLVKLAGEIGEEGASHVNGIGRNFRTRVFVSGFYYFLNTGSLLIPQVWGKTNSLYFSPRKKLRIEIHV